MRRPPLATLPILVLAGCGAAAVPARPAPQDGLESTCRVEPALALIGRPDTPDNRRRALELSDSGMLRVLRPGDGATADYQTGRVNLILDDRGLIAEIRCG